MRFWKKNKESEVQESQEAIDDVQGANNEPPPKPILDLSVKEVNGFIEIVQHYQTGPDAGIYRKSIVKKDEILFIDCGTIGPDFYSRHAIFIYFRNSQEASNFALHDKEDSDKLYNLLTAILKKKPRANNGKKVAKGDIIK